MERGRSWRDEVLDEFLAGAVWLGGAIAVVVVASSIFLKPDRLARPEFWGMLGGYGTLVVLRVLRVSAVFRRWLVPASLVYTGIAALFVVGDRPGPIMLMSVGTVLAAVVVHNLAFVSLLLISGAAFAGAAYEGGGAPKVWIESAAVYLLMTITFSVLMRFVIRKAEESERRAQRSTHLESLGILAGGVAHDFNNSLQVINGFSEVIKQRGDPAIRKFAEHILDATRHAGDLTKQMLVFARNDAASGQVDDIGEHLHKWIPAIQRLLPGDVAIVLKTTSARSATIDESRLHELLLNLVVNARDAMESGGTLTIGVNDTSPPTAPNKDLGWIHLWVTDTGKGMDDSVQSQLFNPFYTTKGDRGTGLGLAMVQGIVSSVGGQVEVTSDIGEGSTFHIYLRAASPTAIVSATVANDAVAESISGTVLLVEDEPGIRGTLSATLAGIGLDVDEAVDGDAAMELLDQNSDGYSLLCIDGIMRGVPTSTVIDRFRGDNPGAPVLVCSGHVEDDLVRRNIVAGDVEFLAKPFTANELVTAVRATLKGPVQTPSVT